MTDNIADRKRTRKNEQVVLSIYSLYSLSMFIVMMKDRIPLWIFVFMMLSMSVCWILYVKEFKSYEFRAYFTAAMIQGCLVFYAMNEVGLFRVLAVFNAVVILLGMYNISKIIWIPVGTITFLIFYHTVIIQSIQLSNVDDGVIRVLQIATVYLVEYVTAFFIKEQNAAKAKLLKVIEELKLAENSKDSFMANVSHEIRTPVNTICGISNIILNEDISADVRDKLFQVQTAGRNLTFVVSNILDFSELQSKKIEIEEVEYNINSMIADVINLCMARKSEKNLELIVQCDADMPCGLFGDEQKIRRVIINLVNNAIKFTGEGFVSLIIGYEPCAGGINLNIAVKDTGIGMEEEFLETVFEEVDKVSDLERFQNQEGIGIGLAISKAIIKKMGGQITVSSKKGEGTEVGFTIFQKVFDEKPVAGVEDRDEINVATYIDMRHFEVEAVRKEYEKALQNSIEQLKISCQVCENPEQIKQCCEKEEYTHVFTCFYGYQANREFFDSLSERTNVVIIIDREKEKYISNKNILRVYKPFFILPIALILNKKRRVREREYMKQTDRFIVPEGHILVVDDNRMNLKVMEGLLKQYQIKTTTAMSGREALEKIESKDYDFVFMDHMMPEMDGIEAFHCIRAKEGDYYKQVPIIALTANALAGKREMFLEEGFVDFVSKPVEVSVLERVLQRMMPKDKIIMVKPVDKKECNFERIVQNKEESEKAQAVEDKEGQMQLGDLNIEKGLLYCGDEEKYLDVLRIQFQDGKNIRNQVETYYNNQDWGNYTIVVHGIKSSMLSIGAERLSAYAKTLEAAGKRGDVEFILQHQETFMQEYDRVYKLLQENPQVNPPRELRTITGETVELEEEQMKQIVNTFEDAVYEFNEEQMIQMLDKLAQCQYHGKLLETLLEPVRKKVEMSDYMSALGVLEKIMNG